MNKFVIITPRILRRSSRDSCGRMRSNAQPPASWYESVSPGIVFLVVLLLSAAPRLCFGCNRYATFNEPCANTVDTRSPSTFKPAGYVGGGAQCHPYKMLQCEARSGTCQCPDFYNYYWDNYNQRCYIKIGSPCKEGFGGIYESWYNHGCPDDSICNPGTGYCQCRPLFKTGSDWIGCSSAISKLDNTSTLCMMAALILSFASYNLH